MSSVAQKVGTNNVLPCFFNTPYLPLLSRIKVAQQREEIIHTHEASQEIKIFATEYGSFQVT